jgi:error-prone DNA polymerase
LPDLTPNEALVAEYAFTGVSAGPSPSSLYRKALTRAGAIASADLAGAPNGAWVRVGGQVIVRQRPPTAKGFTFITIQDEWGQMNLVLRPDLYPKYRLDVRAPGLLAEGIVERDSGVINVRVERLTPLSPDLH